MIDRDYLEKENKAHDLLKAAGYTPMGIDSSMNTVCVIKYEHPEFWDHPIKRGKEESFHFKNWQEARQNLCPIKTYYAVTTSIDDKGHVISNITSFLEDIKKPENTYSSTKTKDIYVDWFDSKEEADDFLNCDFKWLKKTRNRGIFLYRKSIRSKADAPDR